MSPGQRAFRILIAAPVGGIGLLVLACNPTTGLNIAGEEGGANASQGGEGGSAGYGAAGGAAQGAGGGQVGGAGGQGSVEPEPCPQALVGVTEFTCAAAGEARNACIAETLESESCPRGCLRVSDAEDECIDTDNNWSCTGTMGTEKQSDGDYFATAFGCWTDEEGVEHVDNADNCIPACFEQAKDAGLCDETMTGPECEHHVNWYVADASRFGCLARLRVTNPANGREAIVVALDKGPACWVEDKVDRGILDLSGRVSEFLFDGPKGWSDEAMVHVVEVDASTPLGPVSP